MEHGAVNQAVAIGVPDETTGTAVVLYVIVDPGHEATETLRDEIAATVEEAQGKPFVPSEIRFVDEFPKTQSGKIVRRAVEATHTGDSLGDLSSIENPSALDAIDEAE